MKSNIKKCLLSGILFSCLVVISSCDTLESDAIPEIDIENPDLTTKVKTKKMNVLYSKGDRLAIDIDEAFKDLSFMGVEESIKNEIEYFETTQGPLLVFENNNNIQDFLIEFENKKGESVLAKINLQTANEATCGAENFIETTIEKNTLFSVDLLLNEDLCGVRETEDLYSIYTGIIKGEITPSINPETGRPYSNKSEIRGITKDKGESFSDHFSIYTIVPDSNFVGSIEFEYVVAVNWDASIDYGNVDLSSHPLYNNPELSEFYSRHTAVLHVIESKEEEEGEE